MAKEIEIEFKTTISSSEYHELMLRFKDTKKFKQVNHYFDTPDFQLRPIHHNIRIRETKGKYILTLKKPDTESNVEINVPILAKEAKKYLSSGMDVTYDEFKNELPITEGLVNYAKLVNTRIQVQYKGGLLSVDKSEYFDITDYELEFEYFDYKEGLRVFMEILSEFNIRYKKSKPKVRRVYEMYEQKNAIE